VLAAISAGAAFGVSRLLPSQYDCEVYLLVAPSKISGRAANPLEVDRFVSGFARQLGSDPMMKKLAGRLGLDMSPEEMRNHVSCARARGTTMVRISTVFESPETAAAAADELAQLAVKANVELLTAEAEAQAHELEKAGSGLKEAYEDGLARVGRFRVASGVEAIEIELKALEDTIRTLEKQLVLALSAADSHEKAAEVGAAELDKLSAEADFNIGLRLGPGADRKTATGLQLFSIVGSQPDSAYAAAEANLFGRRVEAAAARTEAVALERHLLAVRTRYGELEKDYVEKQTKKKLLTSDAEAAQKAYEGFVAMKTNLLQRVISTGYSVQVLTKAVGGESPSQPNVRLNTAVGLGAGVLLALLAVGVEHYRKAVGV